MNTTTVRSLSQSTPALNLRKVVLYGNGTFLTLMGGPFVIFDLLSYFWGRGPLGTMFYQIGYTIGIVEAHGLAFILGLLLLRAARWEPIALWHLVGAGIHLLLGTNNLLFWAFVVTMDIVAAEIVVTSLHGLLVAVQLFCFWQARSKSK
jgi:hypothetical protein